MSDKKKPGPDDSGVGHVRNFAIIAHVDHGKSTLADRFIELCGGLRKSQMNEQVLDSMDLERERGITIKAQAVTLNFESQQGPCKLNLIDTPGHVDFGYEVSRSLFACEGVLLVIDAAQGVEAQSVANCYAALEQDLHVIPVLNKIDLPSADPETVCGQVEDMIGIDASDALRVSAKTGEGVRELLEAVVERIPPPAGVADDPLRALIIDSSFDNYAGVVSLERVVDGCLERDMDIRPMATAVGKTYQVEDLGVYTPIKTSRDRLRAGDVGYVVAGVKDIRVARVGDTFTSARESDIEPLPGFKATTPYVFAGVYPVKSEEHRVLHTALDKLALNDASLSYDPESSHALGPGFRCGFLGLLHMEIVRERLEREYGLELITTAPTVTYKVLHASGEESVLSNPGDLPSRRELASIMEPMISTSIFAPESCVGDIIGLCQEKRGTRTAMNYSGGQVALKFEMPLNEVVYDFFDKLKSVSHGYASFDYEFAGYRDAPLARLDMLINGERVDALSSIVHREKLARTGRALAERMQGLIPRQLFDIAIPAVSDSRVIARTTVKALRKNVTAKCYGGDVTRKRKLLEKQKAGKKRMKMLGRVEVPQEAFFVMLRGDSSR